jgi:hypothetical protein
VQEYCIECGLRLPLDSGIVPTVGRAWRLEVSRYPGGWLWVVVVLLALTVFATVASIVASDDSASAVRTIVATESAPSTTAQLTKTSPPPSVTTTRPPPTRTATRPSRQTAPTDWPEGRSDHTVVVASIPATRGRESALRLARAAIRAGLPDVGILDSSEFASLRPGYLVVFSGFYQTVDGALAAVETAQARGYPRAYEREITP